MSTKRKDGRRQKKITDPQTGKVIYFYGATEREINKKILEYKTKVTKGRPFIVVSDEWWEEAEPKLSFQTVASYKRAKKAADEYFGMTPIKEIVPKDVLRFLTIFVKQGYSQHVVANQRLILNLIFKHAVMQDDLMYNPCSAVDIPKGLPKTPRTAATETDEQIVRRSSDKWLFPFIALMTGMRKAEILALQWKDIDFDKNIINVTKAVYFEHNKPKIKEPKTEAGVRMVPLLQPLKEVLTPLKQSANSYLISLDGGKTPIEAKQYTNLYSQYQKDTGITCTAHQLRHSFATIAFECGLEPKTVQEILGHKQLSTTMDIYTTFRKKALDEAASKLNASFGT